MTDPIEYELELPLSRTGERLAKTIGRILKHTYQCKRLRIEQTKDAITVKAKVEREHLNAIRGAVRMTCTARGVLAELHRNAGEEQGTKNRDGHSGTSPGAAL